MAESRAASEAISTTRVRRVYVVIPALNERESIGHVVKALARQATGIEEVVVVDNGSDDGTAGVARGAGATVLSESRRGYGAACLRGLRYLDSLAFRRPAGDDVVVFMDADRSDDPSDLTALLEPLQSGGAEMTIGSRAVMVSARRAVPWPSRIGNRLAAWTMRALYGVCYSDLGPFRAIKFRALRQLDMRDTSWGWTLEMQMEAGRRGIPAVEVPVHYRVRRSGKSKISGTLWGGTRAACRMLLVLALYCIADGLRLSRRAAPAG